jgi:hypothetical protein
MMNHARRFDRFFFPGMALLMGVTVFVGFARTYYLAGVFRAPLPNRLIHVHGAVFTSWILLLIAQTFLVAVGRADLHRRLGLLGFGLASLMVILGLMAATDELVRKDGPGKKGLSARTFYVIPVTDILVFAILTYFGFRRRFNPSAHKRLVLIATVMILDAALARWPLPAAWWTLQAAQMSSYFFLFLLVGYDLWSARKIHRVTLWASVFLIVIQQVRIPFGRTAIWQSLAAWVQNVGHSLR